MTKEYQSGVYNIGTQEIRYRRNVVGYGGGLISLALYFLLVFFNLPLPVYISLLVPVFISVHGFDEARNKFCSSYGRSGRYNMNNEVGMTLDVLSKRKRDQDRKYSAYLIRGSLQKSLIIFVILLAASRVLA